MKRIHASQPAHPDRPWSLLHTLRRWFTVRRPIAELQRRLEHDIRKLEARQVKHGELLRVIREEQQHLTASVTSGIDTRLRAVERASHAMLRAHHLGGRDLPMPQAILARRFGILSQNEEDGMVLALFDRVGATNRRFVELGSGTNGGNAGMLALDCGWSGLMVDASEGRIAHVRNRFRQARVVAHAGWVTRENVNDLLRQHGFAGELDLLGIDIDGMDYWVWEALEAASPRVVIAEYNAAFGFHRAVTVPYEAQFDRHRAGVRAYYGASLRAFERLGARRGYRLVALEPRGVNAFFVRNDVAADLPHLSLSPEAALPAPANAKSIYAACERLNLPLVDVSDQP